MLVFLRKVIVDLLVSGGPEPAVTSGQPADLRWPFAHRYSAAAAPAPQPETAKLQKITHTPRPVLSPRATPPTTSSPRQRRRKLPVMTERMQSGAANPHSWPDHLPKATVAHWYRSSTCRRKKRSRSTPPRNLGTSWIGSLLCTSGVGHDSLTGTPLSCIDTMGGKLPPVLEIRDHGSRRALTASGGPHPAPLRAHALQAPASDGSW